MKEEDTVIRNGKGALLGGMLGILAGAWLHPAALFVGVLAGVIVGWWHREIWRSIRRECAEAVDEFFARQRKRLLAWRQFRQDASQASREVLGGIRDELVLPIVRPCFQAGRWLFARPAAIGRWIAAHQTHQAYLLRLGANITAGAINVALYVKFYRWYEPFTKGNDARSLLLIVALCLCVMAIGISLNVMDDIETSAETCEPSLRSFYGHWTRYARLGALRYFLAELGRTLAFQVRWALSIVVGLGWLVGAGGLSLLVLVLPVAAFVGLVRGVREAVVDGGHRLCFAVTLAVTATCFWLGHSLLHWPVAVACLALFAGLASGAATEAVRRGLARFFETNNDAYALVHVDFGIWMAPSWSAAGRVVMAPLARWLPLRLVGDA